MTQPAVPEATAAPPRWRAQSSWLWIRSLPAALRAPLVAADGDLHRLDQDEQRRQYARWFIRMRWTAFVITAALVFLAIEPLHQLPRQTLAPLLITTSALALLNAGYTWITTRPVLPARFLEIQAYLDLVVLTALLHFSGGLENPLGTIMLLHVIIAGAILSRGQCFLVATAGTVLITLMALGEYSGTVSHYTLAAFPHHTHDGRVQHAAHYAPFVLSRLALHGAIMYLTAYFATTLAARIRADERELERYADRLLGQARRLELSLEEQQRAQQMVVRAERLAAVGELAGKVAHEVNNPIAVISAKSRLLLSDERHGMSEKTATELEKIVDLSDRVAEIARSLLLYGRPAPAARSVLDPGVPLRHALAHVAPAARAARVVVVDELPTSLPGVAANAGELEQVFLNLFLNALDAMPDGGTLTVAGSVRQEEGGPGEVACIVQDTGCGIPPDVKGRVFEPFFSTKEAGRGTGLGLAICLGLVRGHGGRIELDSEPGRGTVVTVALPLGLAGAPQ